MLKLLNLISLQISCQQCLEIQLRVLYIYFDGKFDDINKMVYLKWTFLFFFETSEVDIIDIFV